MLEELVDTFSMHITELISFQSIEKGISFFCILQVAEIRWHIIVPNTLILSVQKNWSLRLSYILHHSSLTGT